MVEKDTVACIDTIRLPVVDHNPVGIQLGSTCRKCKHLRLFSHTNSPHGSYHRVSGGRTALSLSEGFLGLCQTVHWLRPATRKRGESLNQTVSACRCTIMVSSIEHFLCVILSIGTLLEHKMTSYPASSVSQKIRILTTTITKLLGKNPLQQLQIGYLSRGYVQISSDEND